MPNEVVNEVRKQYEQALASGGAAADALKGATKVIASRMFQRGSVILEFLQNAEDANAPEFSIDLSSDKVIFQNNGDPFSDKDVKSLCSIGNSAKLVSGGYLGYFGIGFKSAFRISEKVEIFSGDYAFKFDRQCWQDKEPDFPWQIVPHAIDGTPGGKGARFICTLDSGEKGQRSIQSLLERAEHLGRAFMFLKKVKKLEWNDAVNGKPRTFTKTVEHESNVLNDQNTKQQELTLHLGSDKEKWLLFRRTVPVPPEIRNAPETIAAGREQLTGREVVLGFQLDDERKLKKAAGASIYGGIFSHLPLTAEQANLPFIIQGDFVSEGGRDALDEAHPWNHWMLRSAADLLADVAEVFKSHPVWQYQFLDLMLGQVPATASVKQHFFEHLKTKLKEREVVLTDDNNWIKPTSSLVQEILLDEFCKAIGSIGWQEVSTPDRWFVNPNILNRTVIRDHLGGTRLTSKEVVVVLASEEWNVFLENRTKTENAPIWFQRLYQGLAGLLAHQVSAYKGKPWVLTADLITVTGKEARLPSEHIDNVPDSLLNLVFKLSPNAIVHLGVLQDADNKTDEIVKTFLKALDVGDTTIDWFVEKKLLQLMETANWEDVSEVEKTNAIQVILKWFSLNPNKAKSTLATWNAPIKLKLLTKKKGVWNQAGKLYMPTECGGKLEALLTPSGGHPESFVNAHAISGKDDIDDIDECVAFLQAVGIASELRVITAQTIVETKLVTELTNEVSQGLVGKKVQYQTIEFLQALFETWAPLNGDNLFTYLASHWSKGGSERGLFESPSAFIIEPDGRLTYIPGWSPLLAAARLGNWIPTDQGLRSPLALHQKPAFCPIEADKAIVHELAPLVQGELTNVSLDFLVFCGVRDTRQGLNEIDLVLLLRLLSGSAWPKEKAEARLKSLFKRLSNINSGLSEHKDVPVMTNSGTWMPVGQTYVNDCTEAELFQNDLPFAWIPQDDVEQYCSVLYSIGAHSAAKELTNRNTARIPLGKYPFISALIELASINGVIVERYGYLSLTISLGGYDKNIPKSLLVEDLGNGIVRVLLHKDFAAGDAEIAQLQDGMVKSVPMVNLHDVDITDVVERVAVGEVKHREISQKGQNLTVAAIGSGFDFHCSGAQGDYKVEVKGRSEKGDVTLIGEEPDAANQRGKNYLLYVVYNCRSPEPQIKQAIDPAKEWEERNSKSYVVPEKTWSTW